jgi:hypothetical protein
MREQFDASGLSERIGPEHFYTSVRDAVAAGRARQ